MTAPRQLPSNASDMAVTSTNAAPNGLGDLGRLPPELRTKIYDMTLLADDNITIAGRRRTKDMIKRGIRYEGNRFPNQDIVGKIITRYGKQEDSVSVSEVITCGLVAASKAIHHEAAPILYGTNHFIFSTDLALAEFMHKIHVLASFLTRVTLVAPVRNWVHVGGLKCMSKPAIIALQARFDEDPRSAEVTVWARKALEMIKPIVMSKTVDGPQGSRPVRVSLEKQLERLDAFRFSVEPGVLFDGSPIGDKDSRTARFQVVMREVFLQENGAGVNTLSGAA